jgi:uncharacterized protein involved in response to NO
MQISLEPPTSGTPPLLRAGFRPFFLLAGIQAALMVPVWLLLWLGGHDLALSYAPMLWHAHEMLFGFAAAAVAGFLLTAVPNWTGAAPLEGRPLLGLVLLWLAGRIAFDLGGLVPAPLASLISLLFLPALGLALAKPLVGAGKPRNQAFLVLLALLTATQILVAGEMIGVGGWGRNGLMGALFLLLVMIAIIGGRIIPGFTANGLRMAGIVVQPVSRRPLEMAAIAILVAAGVAWTVAPDSPIAGVLAILGGLGNALRLAGWHGWRTARIPLLWVLHLGFACLPLGLTLLGLSCFLPALPADSGLHVLTVGCIGLMVLGVMSRAALGHSGRPLAPARATVAAYTLVACATLVRAAGGMVDARLGLMISAALWSVGFLLFVLVHAPVCLAPRADGRPG